MSVIEMPPPPDDTHDGPSDRDAERHVLGAMLHGDPHAINDATTTITATDYADPRHELIHDAITHLYARGEPVDPIAVTDRLRRTKTLTRAGGPAYIHDLRAAVIITTNIGYYADIVRDTAERRRLATYGHTLIQHALTPDDTPIGDIVERARIDIDTVIRPVPGVDGSAGDYLCFADLYASDPEPIQWLMPPIAAGGRVTTLYAPGKAGKSLIAMEVALALATGRGALLRHGQSGREPVHVLYIDQEQTVEDWRDRSMQMGYGPDDAHLLDEYLHVLSFRAWAPFDTPAGGAQVMASARATSARLVIIDTISKVVAGEENSNDTHQNLYRCTIAQLKAAGIAVLMLDHTGKDLERGARGGSAKTDNVDLAYRLTVRAQDRLTLTPTHVRFRDPATTQPLPLRREATPLAHVEDSWGAAGGEVVGFRPTGLMERLSRLLGATPGLSKTEALDLVRGRAEYKRQALALLIAEGYVRDERGPHNKAVLAEIRPYRQADDPAAVDREEGERP